MDRAHFINVKIFTIMWEETNEINIKIFVPELIFVIITVINNALLFLTMCAALFNS